MAPSSKPSTDGVLFHHPMTHICVTHWTGSTLVHVMAWCLFGTKPLPELMLIDLLSIGGIKLNGTWCQQDAFKTVGCKMRPFCADLTLCSTDGRPGSITGTFRNLIKWNFKQNKKILCLKFIFKCSLQNDGLFVGVFLWSTDGRPGNLQPGVYNGDLRPFPTAPCLIPHRISVVRGPY